MRVSCSPREKLSFRGFTLVEMLASAAICVILASLLLAGFKNVQANGRKTQCLGNLRQISAALFAYAADHNGTLPPVSSTWPPSNQKQTWAYSIWTYAGYEESAFSSPDNDLCLKAGSTHPNIFRCPATKSEAVPVPSVGSVNPTLYSYGLNCRPRDGRAGNGDASADWQSPIPLAKVNAPSSAAMVTETSFCLGSMTGYWSWYGLMPHSSGSNILFYDGHGEWSPLAAIPRSENSPGGKLFWNGNDK